MSSIMLPLETLTVTVRETLGAYSVASAVTVITAVPALTTVTLPLASTVATAGLLEE